MNRAAGQAARIFLPAWCALTLARGADTQWVKARLGSFEAISDNGRRAAIQGLSQFEQFRFALGAVMGKPDLRLDPPLRILILRNPAELAAQGCQGLVTGRDRTMACVTAEGQLPPAVIRALTRRLLDENFSAMPPATERALETFFSTVESNAVHVTWGTPPPASERTREWAMLHRLITQPDYSGRAHIYLHNLAAGMDSNGAIRSLSEDPAKLNADVDHYYAAGVFQAVQAPNRPLNPERDFNTTVLTSDEGQLMRADLLSPESTALYRGLLKAGKNVAAANEGLGMLALRAGDKKQAASYFEAARKDGTRNPIALTAYAGVEEDPERAITILKEALTVDAKFAPAHWALGERITDPARRLAEWKQAVALAPRNYDWWEKYARLCETQKQFAEAGRAWLAAAQAAPDAQRREASLSARGQIDQLRLDDEDAQRRKEATAKAADLERLKEQARRELVELEARANKNPISRAEAAQALDWWEANGGGSVTGTLIAIDCVSGTMQFTVKDKAGKVTRAIANTAADVEVRGGKMIVACGPQKERQVKLIWKPLPGPHKGVAGEAAVIELLP